MQSLCLFGSLLVFAGSSRALQFGGFPKFVNPFENFGLQSKSPEPVSKALKPGDTIAVVGASGKVGRLVALRLSDTYKVNGMVRDPPSVAPFFQGRDQVELFQYDLLKEMKASTSVGPESLALALQNANAIVICTGTTAYPTQAWSPSGNAAAITGVVLKALVDSKFSVKEAMASLDKLGFNTPNNVDYRANAFILKAWDAVCKVQQKRAIMLSSIGVQRRDTMPFPVLNLFGVLDAKAAGEDSLKKAALAGGYTYTIIRPGQLEGGPYDNNYYSGTLFQLDKDAENRDIDVGKGDELLGDTLRSTLAELTAQICEGDHAKDMDFACINVKGESPSLETIQAKLALLQ